MISIIVAIAQNNAIGKAGQLLYHLPNDLKRFKALTTRHTIIMGRKTFESFPKGALPNRRNIVLSHDTSLTFPGAEVFPTLSAAIAACQPSPSATPFSDLPQPTSSAFTPQLSALSSQPSDEIFIIGGASVYRQALPLAQKLYITLIDDLPTDADTFFPLTDSRDWQPVFREPHLADDRHAHPYTFIDYLRRN